MTEVMPEAPLAVSDRSHLYAFLTATDASATALERPVGRGWVGDYQISGKTGHVLANGAGYLLYVHIDERTAMERGPSSRPWKNAKARLTFCKVTQDGDWEGCLHLDRLPTADEAVVIREVLGIRKRRHMTAEALSKLERTRGLIKSPNLAPHSAPEGALAGNCRATYEAFVRLIIRVGSGTRSLTRSGRRSLIWRSRSRSCRRGSWRSPSPTSSSTSSRKPRSIGC